MKPSPGLLTLMLALFLVLCLAGCGGGGGGSSPTGGSGSVSAGSSAGSASSSSGGTSGGAGASSGGGAVGGSSGTSGLPTPTTTVRNWLYQLQGLDLAAAGATRFQLVVTDYSSDGSDSAAYSNAQINSLRNSSGGSKVAIAYMDIGETENYRFYYSAFAAQYPQDIGPANSAAFGGGNFVRFDREEWQAMFSPVAGAAKGNTYIDRIIDAGFDGVYLDVIDAYSAAWPVQQVGGGSLAVSRTAMIRFVQRIRAYARTRNPNFIVIGQNAEELGAQQSYLDAVDGIGKESTYFTATDVRVAEADRATTEAALDVFHNAGKLVLTVDYVSQQANIDEVYTRSSGRGYVPYATVQALNRLTVNSGHVP